MKNSEFTTHAIMGLSHEQCDHYINLSNDQRDQLISQRLDQRATLLRSIVAEGFSKISDEIEEVLASKVLISLEFIKGEFDGQADYRIECALLINADVFFGDYSDNSKFVELVSRYKNICPHHVPTSVSWTIKSTDKRDALSRAVREFMVGGIRPGGIDSISDVEISIQPISTTKHGFDAFNLKVTQSLINHNGGVSNG